MVTILGVILILAQAGAPSPRSVLPETGTVAHKYRPKITLQEAIQIQERYIRERHINITGYWLKEVRMIQEGTAQGPQGSAWFFWWVSETGGVGDYIEISVGMDGKAGRLPSL